ncbi:MAG: hypothetical protein N2037_07300 [Acidimicrobiales bacterium]|nr:hypothetical protein [Acidimicrobiales bacterium]
MPSEDASRPDETAQSNGSTGVESGVPPLGARIAAFVAILLAGTSGGFIGYAITDLQCHGDCTVNKGLGGLAGALIAATGVAIVSVLALRAMSEWKTIQARDPQVAGRARNARRARSTAASPSPRPRVR